MKGVIKGILSGIELLLIMGVSITFVWDSIRMGNQVALEIAMMGFFIYIAIWRLRFK